MEFQSTRMSIDHIYLPKWQKHVKEREKVQQ